MGDLFLCRPGSLPKKIFQQPAKARLTYYSLSTTSSISLTSRSAKPVAGPLPALGSAEYPLERYGIRMQLMIRVLRRYWGIGQAAACLQAAPSFFVDPPREEAGVACSERRSGQGVRSHIPTSKAAQSGEQRD